MAYTTLDNLGRDKRVDYSANGLVVLSIQRDKGMLDSLLIEIKMPHHQCTALLYPCEVMEAFSEVISLILSTMPQTDIDKFRSLANAGKPIPPSLAQAVSNHISLMSAELAIAREKENSRDERGSIKSSAVLK